MPWMTAHGCRHQGCNTLIKGKQSRCQDHRGARRRADDQLRPTAAARGYGARWRQLRRCYLLDHPACVRCGQEATEVDHKLPRRLGGSDDDDNLQALCKTCHSVKTGRLDRHAGQRQRPRPHDGR